jgi:hypothetical protein
MDPKVDAELQHDAVVMVKKYGLLLPAPARAFFRKLAAHLQWTDLEQALK